MRQRVREHLGIEVTVTVIDDFLAEAAIDQAFATLERMDLAYAFGRPDSLVSRYNRGELAAVLTDEFAAVLAEATLATRGTEGWFDPSRPDGVIDLSGILIGLAVERAAEDLWAWGARNFSIDASGDVLTRGSADGDGRPWRVNIADPRRDGYIVAALSGYDLHVASSGTDGRPTFWAPEGKPLVDTTFASVTVTGPSLTWADAAATALTVAGPESFYEWFGDWETQGYAAFGILADGTVTSSSQWKSRRATSSGQLSATPREVVD